MLQDPRSGSLPHSFLDVVAHANDVVIVTDANTGRIAYVNHAFSKLTLYTPEQALGNSPGVLLQGPDTDPRTVKRIRDATSARVGIRTDILNYDKAGRAYWLDMNIVPIFGTDGTVRHFAAIEREVTAQRQLNAELQRMAVIDELTGLANRRSFNNLFKREILHGCRAGESLALIAFDLDHFKSISELYGHDAGDSVLQAVAKRCAPSMRSRDLLARTGGAEFHVLLPDTNTSQAVKIAERLRLIIETTLLLDVVDLIPITASFGVTSVLSDEFEGIPAIMRADDLLCAAKKSGRNRVCSVVDTKASEPPSLLSATKSFFDVQQVDSAQPIAA